MQYKQQTASVASALFLLFLTAALGAAEPPNRTFTPLIPVNQIQIIRSAQAYPGGQFEAENLFDGAFDGSPQSEYASAGKGTETFVEVDLGSPRSITAFKHIDRRDPATVRSSTITFSNNAGFSDIISKVPVTHLNKRGGVTSVSFPPVAARYIRWQVTGLQHHTTVGGAELCFYEAGPNDNTPVKTTLSANWLPALKKAGAATSGEPAYKRPVTVTITYPYLETVDAKLVIPGTLSKPITLSTGSQTLSLLLPENGKEASFPLLVNVDGRTAARRTVTLAPVRPWRIYFLPHSHVDIGYTHRQDKVAEIQWRHLETALKLCEKTSSYPEGARFRWNVEVLWALDSYLQQATPGKKKALIEAVKKGWIGLDALYGSELTGLCRPEELFHTTAFARRLAGRHDLTINSTMITDVPGYSWGLVPALVRSGIRYFSPAPNHMPHLPHGGDRIGYTLEAWGDKPFYWLSPSGEEKLLVWMPGHGYSWFHGWILGNIKKAGAEPILNYLRELKEKNYPYDMVQLRYTIGADNGPPDPDLPEFVRTWNAEYAAPKMIIATTRAMFREFEKRYKDVIPSFSGDLTPYWEDGAASSARETALNRANAEKLVQAQTLWTLLGTPDYPADLFERAWRNVILFSEHTWGAHNSVSQPDSDFAEELWAVKKAFALNAHSQADRLLSEAARPVATEKTTKTFLVVNTHNRPRTDLVVLPETADPPGTVVRDENGRTVPSQMLHTGRLAFLAEAVPPLGAKRFTVHEGTGPNAGSAQAAGNRLTTNRLSITVDPETGAITSLSRTGHTENFAGSGGLNGFFYLPGHDPADAQTNSAVKTAILDKGPLAASLAVTAAAPGCRQLKRIIRVVDGLGYIAVENIVDKEPVRSKESVHFAFPFNVPGGQVRMDMAWSVVRPDLDQLTGANKNCFPIQRWVDVSDQERGITLAVLDAPLIEIGGMVAEAWQKDNERPWLKRVIPSQTIYSYAMNNYWHTNYKAFQEGETTFRYALKPHDGFQPAEAKRFGTARSQPLLVIPVEPGTKSLPALFRVNPDDIMVTSLTPASDGQSFTARIFNPQPHAVEVTFEPGRITPRSAPKQPLTLPGWGIREVRISRQELSP